MTRTGQVSAAREQTREPLRNIEEIATVYQRASNQISAAADKLLAAQDEADDSDELVSFARTVTEARDTMLNCERALAEYLIHRRAMRQRPASELLAIGRGTISRWAQTPEYFHRATIGDVAASEG